MKIGIRLKTVTMVILISVATIITSIVSSYMLASSEFSHEMEHRVTAVTEKLSSEVDSWMVGKSIYLNDTVEAIEFNNMYDHEKLLKYVTMKTEDQEDILSVYVGFKDKQFTEGSGAVLPEGYDPTQRGWYTEALSTEGVVYSAPYLDANTNKMIVSLSKAVKKNGTIIGVAGMDISLGKLNEIISKETDENSEAYLLDRTGNIIIYPDEAFNPTENELINIKEINVPQLVDAVTSASKSGKAESTGIIEVDGEEKIILAATVPTSYWTTGLIFSTAELNAVLDNLVKELTTRGLLMTILVSIAAALFGTRLSKPIKKITELINETADLKLTDKPEYDKICKNRDETGEIARATANLRNQLREIVGELKTGSDVIMDSSSGINSSTESVLEGMKATEVAVAELAQGAAEQAAGTQEGSGRLVGLGESINNVADSSEEISGVSRETAKISSQGFKDMEGLVNTIKLNNISIESLANSVGELENKSFNIANIANAIKAISTQTNLLALNAAIEAAHAGSAGKGFAVVADEIRKLAEQTANSTAEIDIIIDEIKSEISTVREHMDSSMKAMGSANTATEESMENYKKINSAIENMIQGIDKTVNAIQGINDDKDAAINTIQEISAISEEIAASTEELAATTEEQTHTIASISKSTEELAEIAERFSNIVNKFQI